jgi:hypothetical protein
MFAKHANPGQACTAMPANAFARDNTLGAHAGRMWRHEGTKEFCVAGAVWRRDFLVDRNLRLQKFYWMANEVPTLLPVIIVVMVIARPF